jgi:UDP-2-acetamido-3-amino-2,3-dideoxy-glucuronate N-acetyltransferase
MNTAVFDGSSENCDRKVTKQIACVGGGYWGRNIIRNLNELSALSWICETDQEQRAQLRSTYPRISVTDSIERILCDSEITGVAIATPALTHGDLVRQALLADKDVFVEKPLCLSVDEGEKLVALAAERRRILMVGHLLWYHSAALKLKKLVEEGELGRVQYIYSNRLNLGKIRREENILWSFAPHDISLILGLVSEMPDLVQAQGGNYLHNQIADVTLSLLSFPSGIKAHIFVSWLHPYKEQKLIVVGDRKMAVFDDLASQNKLVVYPHAIGWRNHQPVPKRAEGQPVSVSSMEPLKAECMHFVECIKTRQTPLTDGMEGLRVLTVLQQCQQALGATAGTPPQRNGGLTICRYAGNGMNGKTEEISRNVPASCSERPYFVHGSAFVDEQVEIGEGTTIWHFSHLMRNSRVGRNCRIGQNVVIGPNVSIGNRVKIQNNVSVYEGVTLEDDVFCGPSMVFTNVFNPRSEIPRMDELRPTLVRRGTTLGANCTIVCGVTIGQYAFVGAGAVVTRNVPDFALVVGNPARVVGWVCACGRRIDLKGADGSGVCRSCQRLYRKVGLEVSLQS